MLAPGNAAHLPRDVHTAFRARLRPPRKAHRGVAAPQAPGLLSEVRLVALPREPEREMRTMANRVQRGGEVQPDGPDKGSDADKARHEQGRPPEDTRTDRESPRSQPDRTPTGKPITVRLRARP
jgi:hypothetical protein